MFIMPWDIEAILKDMKNERPSNTYAKYFLFIA